jgi:hypothetical protein
MTTTLDPDTSLAEQLIDIERHRHYPEDTDNEFSAEWINPVILDRT